MNKTKRTAVILACVLFFAMLLSVLFIAHRTQHECSGEGCGICMKLEACESSLRNISGSEFASAVLAAVCFVIMTLLLYVPGQCVVQTPVSLKVKLSD